MVVQYASDLHLEFPENKEFLEINPLKPKGDLLLLAGDIVPFYIMDKHKDFFNYVSVNFEQTYWVPGNHEYYYFNLGEKHGVFHEQIKSNVHLLNNTVVNHKGIDLVFSTLWSKIRPGYQWQIERGISDFHVIEYNGYKLSANRYNQMHDECMTFLQHTLQQKNRKSIVVSHHVPTFSNYPDKYKGSILNDAFAVELYDLIEKYEPDYWIYGHSHHNTAEFEIGKTALLTNQLGYVRHGEHHSFCHKRIIET